MTRLSVFVASALVVFAQSADAQTPDKIQGKTAAEWIETLKSHEDVKFRRVALIIVEVYGPRTDGVVPAVVNALEKDSEPQIRREAAMLLGRMGADAKDAVFALGDALKKDRAEAVREAAAQALGGKLLPFAAEQVLTLAEALNDPHAGTRTAAAEAILKLGDKAAAALPSLMALARDASKDRFSRQYAVKCLSKLAGDSRESAGIMIAIVRDKDAAVQLRQEAADGLGRSTVAAEVVIPPLAEALGDSSVEVQRAAAAALARQGKDAAIAWPKVAEGLKNSDQAVRYQLIRLCGRLSMDVPAAGIALVDRAKNDPYAENRIAAIQELGELGLRGPDDGLPTLENLAQNDPSPAIRGAAETALKKARGSQEPRTQ